MKVGKYFIILFLYISLFYVFDSHNAFAQMKWYQAYEKGLEAMKDAQWQQAIKYLESAVRVKDKDKAKTRAYGAVFISYFPHREMGICWFNLGYIENAKQELLLSIGQSSSFRAKEYLKRIEDGDYPSVTPKPAPTTPDQDLQPRNQDDLPSAFRPKTDETPPAEESNTAMLVGERLSIAILPFSSKGIGNAFGEIDLLDKLITGFVNVQRFKIIERAQLEKILAEQKLGLSGVVDASTAAQIGKGIGVDAVMTGSVTVGQNAVSIDARLIDTETAAILSAQDAFSSGISLQALSQMLTNLAQKVKNDFPIVNGFIIGVNNEKLTLDVGLTNGIKKGMKCNVFREGAPIVHPVTGKVIGKMIDEICEIQIIDAFDAYSFASITKIKKGTPSIQDKIITK